MKITVRIGAALDADLQKILYEPMAQGMGRARQRARTESKAMFDEIGARAKESIKAETAVRLIEERKRAQESLTYTKSRLAQERALAQQERGHELAMERDAARQRVREDEKAARDSAQARKEVLRKEAQARKEIEGGVRSFASGAAGTARSIASRGVGVAADIARGAGVSFDISAGVKKRVDLEKSAIDLSNSAYQEKGEGISTQRADPRELMRNAQEIGQQLAIAPELAMAGLQKFTAVTGDLATARASLLDMARLSKATGSNLDHVVATAGEISKGMGDAAKSEEEATNRAKQLYEIMKGVAGGGKLGSVEMSDTAKHGGRMAAAATQFSGGVGENVLKMAALLQEARGGGGAWNAATAAGAVSGLVSNFKTPARQKAFAAAGIQIFDKDKKIRDPFALLTEAIDKTAADPRKLQPLFANVVGARAMQNLANIYLDKTGGKTDAASRKKGREAIQAEFERMTTKATMSENEVRDSLARAMDSTGSKVELFQQKLDRVVGDMADNVIPAMTKLSKPTLGAAEGLAKIATWAANNPLMAGVGVAGVSLAKAGVDAAAGKVADKVVSGVAGAGALGSALVATMVIASVGALTIDKVLKDQTDAQKKRLGEESGTLNTITELRGAMRGAAADNSPEAQARLEKAKEAANEERSRLQDRITKGREALRGDGTGALASAANSLAAFMNLEGRVGGGQTMEERAKAQEDAKNLDQLSADMKVIGQILGGNLKVEIQNLSALPQLGGAVTGPGGGG